MRGVRIVSSVCTPTRITVLAVILVVALRLPFVGSPPYTDEGGLLVVASHWQSRGPFLYGSYFVDRPPLLLAFFRLAWASGGVAALRELGLVLVAGAVACAARAGFLLGGRRGAIAAALTCAALLADPQLGTREVDAETVGVPLVLLAAMLALEGARRPDRLFLLGSGAAGSAAVLVKQNMVDGLVFAVALILAVGLSSRAPARRTVGALSCLVLGAALPATAALAWSASVTGDKSLWFSMYGFRLASSAALFGHTSTTELSRLHALGMAAVLSGLVLLIVVALASMLWGGGRDTVTVALVAMLAAEVVGVAGGGYYWDHYLIGLVPATCLLVGRAAGVVSRQVFLRVAILASVVAAGAHVVSAVTQTSQDRVSETGALSAWLDRAERPGDSAVVLYGEAAMFETTRLRPVYPYLWTLPQRILDPHLIRLARTMREKSGPTFVVVRTSLDPWHQDPRGRIRTVLDQRFRLAADVCGDSVYVRRGLVRTAPRPADCS